MAFAFLKAGHDVETHELEDGAAVEASHVFETMEEAAELVADGAKFRGKVVGPWKKALAGVAGEIVEDAKAVVAAVEEVVEDAAKVVKKAEKVEKAAEEVVDDAKDAADDDAKASKKHSKKK